MDPPKTKPEDSAPEVGPQQTAKPQVTEETSINTPNSDEQSSGPIPDVSQTVPGSENNLGTQSYDSQWMKQQNDRVENLMKKVKFQKSKDKEIMVEVEHHGVHKSEKILIRKKTKKLTEEIVTLKSKNSQLNKQISELRLSWEMEKRAKEEAEKKVKILLDENIHHSEETAELQKEITRLEETISILEIKSEQETEHWKMTTKYTETGDTVDGTGINFGGFRKTDSSIEIMIAEHESQEFRYKMKSDAEGVTAEHIKENIKTETTETSKTNSGQDVNPQETGSPQNTQSGSGMKDTKAKPDQGGKNKTGTSSQTPIQKTSK